ncbi:hypothetical protein [Actinomadura sp. 21ATH]|uniref:imine reductase family protein n=1 Tax=Actinomadura sp. 21ATH TaxID=1735444 RepID=UPI0035BF3B22
MLFNTALLGMMYATLNGFLHAAALADSAGVPVAAFADSALGWFMPVVLDPAGLAEQAIARGHGTENCFALFEILKNPAAQAP